MKARHFLWFPLSAMVLLAPVPAGAVTGEVVGCVKRTKPKTPWCVGTHATDLPALEGGYNHETSPIYRHLVCGIGPDCRHGVGGHGAFVPRVGHGLDVDPEDVKKTRETIRSLGIYGPVSVDTADGKVVCLLEREG